MKPDEASSTILPRWLVWALTVTFAMAVVALVRVPTHLGVKVVEANQNSQSALTSSDFRGRDYLWRVWWRARGDFVDVSPSWLLGLALIAGLAVFVVGIFAAYRIALSIPSSPPPRDA